MAEQKTGRKMTPEEVEEIKQGLIERKRALWRQVADDLENDARDEYQELIQSIRDEGDAALDELRESSIFSLIDLKVEELEKIEDALTRIEEGEYGRCVDCGRWITPARLEVMPYAVRCRACQERREKISSV